MEVCLVGAGPRGLSVLERLCAQERGSPRRAELIVHVVDPGPAGSGRVWRPTQSRHLLMNTVASQVTVYTDASVSIEGPLEGGPSLYEWAAALLPDARVPGTGLPYDDETLAEARDLGPDGYPTRALYGHYLTWVFEQVTAGAPDHVTVRVHTQRAVALEEDPRTEPAAAPQTVVLEDGTRLTGLSAVVLAQGHVPVAPTDTERDLAAFADRHGLTYVLPANPADVDLSGVAPGESVLLRGLGLNFFDYMALFTHARGGVFERDADGRLVYRPSGREPRLYAGSRRGVPYQARGDNEKGAHGRYLPRLLTPEYLASLRAPGRRPLRFGTDLWPLISKEVACVYSETLLANREKPERVAEFARRYLACGTGPEETRLLQEVGIGPEERWDWRRITHPYGDRRFEDAASFHLWLRDYLDEDVRLAREGNVSGPVKAALDVLRDLRNEVRLAVDHAGLDADSHREELDGWYTPLNAYLSIGPPASRIEEMAALMDAGILQVTGPGIRVEADPQGPCFVATSTEIEDVRVRAGVLIEARLPEIDLRRTADPLMRHLLLTGRCRPHRVPGSGGDYETGGLAVTERPYHLLDAEDVPHPRRFAYGVPTESVHWVTAAGIRPGVGSVTLEDSDAIAGAVLALPAARTRAPAKLRSALATRDPAPATTAATKAATTATREATAATTTTPAPTAVPVTPRRAA
ncbi:FAD/NAD(P)-binding protein [Streptomyces caniscabiei]|uniref:FAD/NAD(P)-binding protein n=1 Tax=Streptomyces caniscabiei TaxID=2746961 RepID=A0A927LEI9_9ACTN|nr:FAD/NAD(P)-binding protein [Streptomyces caniscabiei]MBD9729324.1 FAD/NAD(P)-binding protein [Streptomyces caniscabiei]MDX3514990.1 FAD/NAD(P)-binding protein [Streptomyces caniscabiei]MDX3724390.1 FAD/NAD(P)-binding protein [Streptomyces caniscabiei]